MAETVQKNQVEAVHDVGEGGLGVALAEMAISGTIGMNVSDIDDHRALFNESGGRVVVALNDTNLDPFLDNSRNRGVPAQIIGRTGGSSLVLGSAIDLPLDELIRSSRDELAQDLGQGTVSA